MEGEVQKSCWGVMAWTIVLLGGVLLVVGLLGGFEASTVIASQ